MRSSADPPEDVVTRLSALYGRLRPAHSTTHSIFILFTDSLIFVLMKASLQQNGKMVGVSGSVMTMAVAALL
jgi:hypothetical protein